MPALVNRLSLIFKALTQLGPQALALYAWYQAGLRLWLPQQKEPAPQPAGFRPFFSLPQPSRVADMLGEQGLLSLQAEVEEIIAGQVRLFGKAPVPLVLAPWRSLEPLQHEPGPLEPRSHEPLPHEPRPLEPRLLAHWTAYERGLQAWGAEDVKFIWEPGRFGWVYPLARRYLLAADERCPQAFWSYVEAFLTSSPPYSGPHWASAQEVALRLIAFVFGLHVFGTSPHTTQPRAQLLADAVASHAARIPATLAYARSQNNNHLLTEAAGLYTAAAALPDHPQAAAWKRLGWKWFNRGIQQQVDPSGAYSQHSANYHRLMLQIALWMEKVSTSQADSFPPTTRDRLASATRWLFTLLDPLSGRVPNLGPNDGAYLFPFTACEWGDYRPVLAAASETFLGKPAFKPGPWDEMALWLGVPGAASQAQSQPPAHPSVPQQPLVLRQGHTWAYLRAAHFNSRPGHADQLHLDLWWRGLNIVQDAGTYLYNAPPPWQNALSHTAVHNTLRINGQDQMRRVSRFLWLDWAQAAVIESPVAGGGRMAAEHTGYKQNGIIHRRAVELDEGRCQVLDDLYPTRERTPSVMADIHWLLPDLPWSIDWLPPSRLQLKLETPSGPVRLAVECVQPAGLSLSYSLIRAGESLLDSQPADPAHGWVSPTYACKIPALALSVAVQAAAPIRFVSEFQLGP